MPPPSNITRLTAIDVGVLPAEITQSLNDAGVTYDVWYKYSPASDTTLKIYGDGLPESQIGVDVYQDAESDTWLEMPDLWANINLPIYIPLLGGHTYYFLCYVNGPSITFIDGAELNLSVSETPTETIVAGDFLVNYEIDFDGEYPAAARSGTDDYTIRSYVQVSEPVFPRTDDGLPHGESGQIFSSGVVVWSDEQFDNIKFYNANTLALIATVALAQPTMAMCRALNTLYTLEVVTGVSTLRTYDDTGTEVAAAVIGPITTAGFMGVNSAGTILYYVQPGTSAIHRWDLVNDTGLSDLVADTAGYKCEDLMVLEDDTVLMVFMEEASSPTDVYVKQFDPAGATLNTYNFGDFWRGDFNPPRIGYALDSPDTFWIRLQPEANFALAIHRHIDVATGTTLATVNHTNYLGGTSLSGISQGFANTFNTTFTVLPAAGLTYDAQIQVTVNEAFANGSGTQSTFQIGTTSDPDLFVPASTFTNQPMGANFIFPITVAAGEDIVVTGTTRTGTGTGRIFMGVFMDDTLGTLGAEKSGALLLVPTTAPPPFPPFVNGPEALEAFEAAGLLLNFDVPRVRTAPHLADENQRLFYSRFELDLESGVGTVTGQGVDPVVLMRYSNDGGFTWSAWRQLSVGRLGQYKYRCDAWNLGMARDRVFQIRQTDPVKTTWLTAYLEFEGGSN